MEAAIASSDLTRLRKAITTARQCGVDQVLIEKAKAAHAQGEEKRHLERTIAKEKEAIQRQEAALKREQEALKKQKADLKKHEAQLAALKEKTEGSSSGSGGGGAGGGKKRKAPA